MISLLGMPLKPQAEAAIALLGAGALVPTLGINCRSQRTLWRFVVRRIRFWVPKLFRCLDLHMKTTLLAGVDRSAKRRWNGVPEAERTTLAQQEARFYSGAHGHLGLGDLGAAPSMPY